MQHRYNQGMKSNPKGELILGLIAVPVIAMMLAGFAMTVLNTIDTRSSKEGAILPQSHTHSDIDQVRLPTVSEGISPQ